MDPLLIAARALYDQARGRIAALAEGDRQAGALTLEWIVIAGILVVAAVAAGLVFTRAIKTETAKLP